MTQPDQSTADMAKQEATMRISLATIFLLATFSCVLATRCDDCEMMVSAIHALSHSESSPVDISQHVSFACQDASAPTQVCKRLLPNAEDISYALNRLPIQGSASAGVCGKLGFCRNLRIQPMGWGKERCNSCKGIFSTIENWLQNNTDSGAIKKRIEFLCVAAPPSYQIACRMILDNQWPKVIQMIKDKTTPEAACEAIRICDSNTTAPTSVSTSSLPTPTPATRGSSSSLACDACSIVASYVKDALLQSQIPEKIATKVDQLFCNSLPASFGSVCDAMLSVGYDKFISQASTASTEHLCSRIHLFCQ
ncbi:surfactant B protein [Planoprotostelium fungivorum]|uniref:Surfactant B protein n=1 Tax=Planoprotostelium fungivorum TaxID=1890364 RepID=A0A2P6NYC9_9EUKA|nr:surfactant B protein [Planoprotostelium fungivorum]